MKISSIIAEYNPLHNGHVYHIQKTKEVTDSDAIICIMSGNYVQRGIPAIIDKWNRTRTALECGADLVIELPVIYSLSSAEFFAQGAVSLLNSLGLVDSICFGSELGDMNFILSIAGLLNTEPEDFKVSLRKYLDEGATFPLARSKALEEYISSNWQSDYNFNLKEVLNSSNNILAIEYCKSLLKLKSSIKPFTIRREGGTYNSQELNNTFSSATSIRKFLKGNSSLHELEFHLPKPSYRTLINLKENNYNFVFEDSMFKYIKYKSFTSPSNINNLPDVSEGLDNKIYKAVKAAESYHELTENVKSKRYTYTRIGRILCQYFIGFENYDTEFLRTIQCPHARVLGFNEVGTNILKALKETSSIPVYNKLPKILTSTLSLDLQATKSYSLLNNSISPSSDYLISPIKI
jgi:predicted nucleotidyltransferase